MLILRQVRVDFYRLIRSKSIYISLIVIILFAFLNAYEPIGSIASFGISEGEKTNEFFKEKIITGLTKNDKVEVSTYVVFDKDGNHINQYNAKEFTVDENGVFHAANAKELFPGYEKETPPDDYTPVYDENGEEIPFDRQELFEYNAKKMNEYSQNSNYDIVPEFTTWRIPTAFTSGVFKAVASASFMTFIILVVINIIVATEFSASTLKNTLSYGTSRVCVYFSKLLSVFIASIILYIIYILATGIIAQIMHPEYNVPFTTELFEYLLNAFTKQLALFIGLISFGFAVIFLTGSTAALNGIYIAFPYATLIILMILISTSSRDISYIVEYTLDYQFSAALNGWKASGSGLVISEKLFPYLLAAGYTSVFSAVGYLSFKKKEIK